MVDTKLPAGQFKAQCLQLMDLVQEKHISIVITKHGTPVAKLVPLDETTINLFGALKGSMRIVGDIIAPIDDKWDAES